MSPDGTIATDDPEKILKLALFSLEKAADIILWIDAGARIHYANEAACQAYGYTRDELLSMAVTDLNPGYTKASWLEHWSEVKRRRSLTYEACHRRKDGTTFPIDVSINYLRFGDVEYNCASIRDITRRKDAEAALHRSESGLEKAQQIARMGSWEWDIVNDVVYRSRELVRLYNYGTGQGTVGTFLDAVHPEDRERVRSSIAATIDDHKPYDVSFRIVKNDHSLRYLHAEAEITYGEDGRPVRMFGIAQDVTERVLAEEALKEAKARAELYVDLMGHDINNMNQIAMGYLEMAIDSLDGIGHIDKGQRPLLAKPYETLRETSHLISNVRKVQREKAGLYPIETMDVDAILRDVTLHYSNVSGREVSINYTAGNRCMVMANELLKDVFLNLVGNAIKHSEGPLTVNIVASAAICCGKKNCQVAVEDNGPGIPDEMKSKLFDRLTLDGTMMKGKGFGLCLIKMLIDDYDGQFRVEDRVAGDYSKGSRFVVTLPVVDTEVF
ncbi:MAG: PAS domain S-box protein [Methanocella sp.]